MPQRIPWLWTLLLGLSGLALVAALLILGKDIRRAAERGPRWKRRLIAAAMVLAAALVAYESAPKLPGIQKLITGALPEDTEFDEVQTPDPPLAEIARMSLDETPQWKRLMATWAIIEDIARGKRGEYPYSQAGRRTLFRRCIRSMTDLDALVSLEQLSEPEAALLKDRFSQLRERLWWFRTTEEQRKGVVQTCYAVDGEALAAQTTRETLNRLSNRVSLLMRLVEEDRLAPPALARVVPAIEDDLGYFTNPRRYLGRWDPGEEKEAADMVRRTELLLVRLKKRMDLAPATASAPAEAAEPEK